MATKNKIPIVRNPPLARALYDTTDVDEEIPYEHHAAVAKVIKHVYKLKGKTLQKGAAPKAAQRQAPNPAAPSQSNMPGKKIAAIRQFLPFSVDGQTGRTIRQPYENACVTASLKDINLVQLDFVPRERRHQIWQMILAFATASALFS